MTHMTTCYAEALFALALETDNADTFREGLQLAAAVLKEDPEYLEFLGCYGIPAAERTAAIEQALGDKLPEFVLSFLQLMIEHGHIKGVFECAAEYEKLYMEARAMSTVKVTSAVPLTDDQRKKLEEALVRMCRRQVIPTYEVDPALKGGIVVEADGKTYDGSVRHRLQEVKEVINR